MPVDDGSLNTAPVVFGENVKVSDDSVGGPLYAP
jgi:hypothetical protein